VSIYQDGTKDYSCNAAVFSGSMKM